MLLRELGRLPDELLRNRQPGHDVQLDGRPAAHEPDRLGHAEPEPAVQFQVEGVAAFEVADAVFHVGLRSPSIRKSWSTHAASGDVSRGGGGVASATYLLGGVLDQILRVPFAPGSRFRADVDEVPGVGVVPAEDVVFGVVQQGEELVEEALLALLGEFPVEAEHAAPEHGAEVVHVLVRGHPVSRGAC